MASMPVGAAFDSGPVVSNISLVRPMACFFTVQDGGNLDLCGSAKPTLMYSTRMLTNEKTYPRRYLGYAAIYT